jgi:hypothetical protein
VSTRHRTARSHRPTDRTARPAPRLHGHRELAAVAGLAHPTPLPESELADLPPACVIPPDEVARTHQGLTRVLADLGQPDLLRGEIVDGLRDAAGRGRGLSIPPHMAKALWRFCDAFSTQEPLLRGAREGLRVHVTS